MLHWVDRWQTENIRSFSPKKEAVDDFVEHVDKYMQCTVWTEDCRSWYKNGTKEGRVMALWPGSSLHFMEVMEYPRHDDFDVRYNGNRFSWMGSGYSQTEMDPSADWAYYITNSDDSPFSSKSKRRKVLTNAQSATVPYAQLKEATVADEKLPLVEVVEIQSSDLAV